MANVNKEAMISEEEIRNATQLLAAGKRQKRLRCDHHDNGSGRRYVQDLSRTPYFKNRPDELAKYPEKAVMCTGQDGCGAIFDTMSMSPEVLENAKYVYENVFNQIKYLAGLNDTEMDSIVDMMDKMESISEQVFRFYLDMVDNLRNKDNNRKNTNRKINKGRVGVPRGNFGM